MGVIEGMRSGVDTPWMKFIFFVIIITFIFWGSNNEGAATQIVAEVNGKKITDTQFNQRMRLQARGLGSGASEEELAGLQRQVMGALVQETVLLQEADRLGIEVADREIADQLKAYTSVYATLVRVPFTAFLDDFTTASARSEAFAHLQRLPSSFFDRNPVGRLMTRVTTDVAAIHEAFTSGLVLILDDLVKLAGQAAAEYRNALRLLHPRSPNWKVEVKSCSARDGTGIADAWHTVLRHHEMLESTSELMARRAAQARDWMWSDVSDNLVEALKSDPEVRKQLAELEASTSEGRIPPTVAARQLLDLFLEKPDRE